MRLFWGKAPPPPTSTAARPPRARLGHTSAKKFSLLASISVHAQKSSPSTAKTGQNQRFFACRANFFTVCSRIHSCWASFFALIGAQPPHNTRQPPRLKPMTPLRAPWRTRLKPLTPLLPQNSQFQAIFRPQRRRRFHAPLTEYPQRRRRFHQASNQGWWFTARCSDAHACCLRHNPGSVRA